jgi:L-seryl-tRNA(Ser) seleniumtransferase
VSTREKFRALPSVDELANSVGEEMPRDLVVNECRRVLNEIRALLRSGAADIPDAVEAVRLQLAALRKPSLRRVINATGVILHTNLGRAPLTRPGSAGWYSNLEYDLATGKRGKRDVHTSVLLERLLGAPAVVVNNGAAAVFLALHELASGAEVIVSRGELVEIGDGFRIPDIMQRSGAKLVEVGTTNRTRIDDYRQAITDKTALLLRVHPSNFRMQGFTGRPSLPELVNLARECRVPLYEDLGSGCLSDLRESGVLEPTVGNSLSQGVDLVSFSGDKLLGGPQAGIIAGRPELVQRVRRNPMFRALRVDKMVIGALEETLRYLLLQQWNEVPVLRMLRQETSAIRERAEQMIQRIPGAEVVAGESLLGGGSTPEQTLPTYLIAMPGDSAKLEARLRAGEPPVIARIEKDRLVLDLRTVASEEDIELTAVLEALA